LVVAVWLFLTGVELQALARSAVPQYLVALAILVAEVVALRWDPARWVSFAAGAWLVVAPLALGYPSPLAALNSFACGLVVSLLASRANQTATYSEPPTMQRELFRHQGGGKAIR
jgi:vancomycin permeability regulator SanA